MPVEKGRKMGTLEKMKTKLATHRAEVAKKNDIRKAEIEKQRADEEARQSRIAAGKIDPIKTECNLDKDEKAYVSFSSAKMGKILHTVNTTHKQDVVGRAGCGCCLLGPLGALLGGATAPSQTKQNTYEKTGILDEGVSYITDKRFIFVGKSSMKSLPYKDIMNTEFVKTTYGSNLYIRYPEMANGEFYSLSGSDAKIAELWFQGIKKKAGTKQ